MFCIDGVNQEGRASCQRSFTASYRAVLASYVKLYLAKLSARYLPDVKMLPHNVYNVPLFNRNRGKGEGISGVSRGYQPHTYKHRIIAIIQQVRTVGGWSESPLVSLRGYVQRQVGNEPNAVKGAGIAMLTAPALCAVT